MKTNVSGLLNTAAEELESIDKAGRPFALRELASNLKAAGTAFVSNNSEFLRSFFDTYCLLPEETPKKKTPLDLLEEAVTKKLGVGKANDSNLEMALESKDLIKIEKAVKDLIHCIGWTNGKYLTESHLTWRKTAVEITSTTE